MSENMELLRMIMENNAGQSPSFILKQYAIYKAGLTEINKKCGTQLTPENMEALAATTDAVTAGKDAKSSPTVGYTKRSLKVNPAEAIQQDKVICCICGAERKTITSSHLATHNGLTREGYLKLCGYPADQKLMSHSYYEKMKKYATKAQEARRSKREKKAKEGM